MDDRIYKAICEKIYEIFYKENESEFLSFPNTYQYNFSPNLLIWNNNLESGDNPGFKLNAMSEFSTIMNHPVRSENFDISATEDTSLWDICNEILTYGKWAQSTNSQDDARFKEAFDFLYVLNDDGLNVKSEAYQKYLQIKDAIITANEELENIQSSDNNPQRESEINKIKELINDLKIQLAQDDLGRKVDNYKNIIDQYYSNNPVTYVDKLKEKLSSEKFKLTDLNSSEFPLTYLYPNAVHLSNWKTVSLSAEELGLVKKTAISSIQRRRVMLKSRLITASRLRNIRPSLERVNGDDISKITFEYRSAKIERPWFDSSLFESRNWRFTNEKEALSVGYDQFGGSFPAYITALVLSRNFRIIKNDGTVEEESSDNKEMVSVLAYICKKLNKCPNPDPDAVWGTGLSLANVVVSEKIKNEVTIHINGHIVSDGAHEVGKIITFKTNQKEGKILKGWLINNCLISDNNYKCSVELTKEGIKVDTVWDDILDSSDIEIESIGSTLNKVKKCPSELDMKQYETLRDIEQIEEKAFENRTNLTSITIGPKVKVIERHAFLGCRNLKKVSIPASVNNIDPLAFDSDGKKVEISIDPENQRYCIIDNQLIERQKVSELKVYKCKCGSSLLIGGDVKQICPNCGNELIPELMRNQANYIVPTGVCPIAVNAQSAVTKAKDYLRNKFYVLDDFKKSVDSISFTSSLIYVPFWKCLSKAEADYNLKEKITNKKKTDDGKEVEEVTEKKYQKSTSVEDKNFVVSASSMQFSKNLKKTDLKVNPFNIKTDLQNSIVELPTVSLKQIKENLRENMNKKLDSKATSNKDSITILSKNTVYTEEQTDLCLYPYWKMDYKYKDISYNCIVDGVSGEILNCESYPVDEEKLKKARKIALIGVCVLLVVIFILYLIFK